MAFAKKIADVLCDNKTIKEDDKEYVEYGLEVFFSSMVEIFTILIISAFVGNFLETLIFFASFVPLRIYAGGFHADTKFGCFFVSIAVYMVFTLLLFNLEKSVYMRVVFWCIAINNIVIWTKAPILHKNKTRTENEVRIYRKLVLNICSIESLICLICFWADMDSTLVLSICLGMTAVSVSMLMAIIKNKIYF